MRVDLGALHSRSARVNLRVRYLCGKNSGSGAERDCGGFQRTKKHNTKCETAALVGISASL